MLHLNQITNKVLNGDCEKVLENFPNKCVDLIFTSPPYLDLDKYDGYKGPPAENYISWMMPKIQQFSRVLKDSGSFILNIDTKTEDRFKNPYIYELITRIIKETDLKLFDTLYWNKLKGLPIRNRFWSKIEPIFWFAKSRDFKFYIDEFRRPYSPVSINRMKKPIKKRFARTEKNQSEDIYKEWKPNPLGALPSNLIEISSESKRICDNHVAVFPETLASHFIRGATNFNDLVLDPFAGTFTTCAAAKNMGVDYCGIELNKEYCDFGIERLNNICTI